MVISKKDLQNQINYIESSVSSLDRQITRSEKRIYEALGCERERTKKREQYQSNMIDRLIDIIENQRDDIDLLCKHLGVELKNIPEERKVVKVEPEEEK